MKLITLHKTLNYFIAGVWLINGLYCKVLNQVPRHQEIVAAILGESNSRSLTFLIGCSEILMSLWILSGYKSKINAFTQVTVVLIMNIMEYALVPDLLLWGRFNIVFAILFSLLVYYNEFVVNKKLKAQR